MVEIWGIFDNFGETSSNLRRKSSKNGKVIDVLEGNSSKFHGSAIPGRNASQSEEKLMSIDMSLPIRPNRMRESKVLHAQHECGTKKEIFHCDIVIF